VESGVFPSGPVDDVLPQAGGEQQQRQRHEFFSCARSCCMMIQRMGLTRDRAMHQRADGNREWQAFRQRRRRRRGRQRGWPEGIVAHMPTTRVGLLSRPLAGQRLPETPAR
jgi:hypothetical protein